MGRRPERDATSLSCEGDANAYYLQMSWQYFIVIDPAMRSGKPHIAGTSITVSDVLEYLAGGMGEADILADFPDVKSEHSRAVLVFAAERERRLSGPFAA